MAEGLEGLEGWTVLAGRLQLIFLKPFKMKLDGLASQSKHFSRMPQ
jgi:hypothetical protein